MPAQNKIAIAHQTSLITHIIVFKLGTFPIINLNQSGLRENKFGLKIS